VEDCVRSRRRHDQDTSRFQPGIIESNSTTNSAVLNHSPLFSLSLCFCPSISCTFSSGLLSVLLHYLMTCLSSIIIILSLTLSSLIILFHGWNACTPVQSIVSSRRTKSPIPLTSLPLVCLLCPLCHIIYNDSTASLQAVRRTSLSRDSVSDPRGLELFSLTGSAVPKKRW